MTPVTTMLDSPLTRRRQREIICTQFEAMWKTGPRPTISDFLNSVHAEDRNELLRELLPLDTHYRRKMKEEPRADDYVPDNLDQAEIINEHFGAIRPTATGPGKSTAPADAFPDVPGYTISHELGRGGMGVVYLARQHQPRRWVALKTLKDRVVGDPIARQRFSTEWDAVARLQHANILPIYAVSDLAGRPFMVTEYAVAGSLDRFIDGKPVAPKVAAALMERLARGMAHVHANGVIHRDLKPSNVLMQVVDSRFQYDHGSVNGALPPPTNSTGGHQDIELDLSVLVPKITDFGLAKVLNGTTERLTDLERKIPIDTGSNETKVNAGPTMAGERLGTPSYMAPEQAQGKNNKVGSGTDIYALGAIFYEMLTGRPPFLGPTSESTLDQVVNQEPVRPRLLQPTVPRDLEVICLKCLEKSPTQRYATAAELAEDLRRFQANEPIKARRHSFGQRLSRWFRKHPTQLAVAGCLLLVFTGQFIAMIMLNDARLRAEKSLLGVKEIAEIGKRIDQCLADARMGRTSEALAIAGALVPDTDWPAAYHYGLAQVYSQCCRPGVWGEEQQALIAKAVNCLNHARELGHFSSPSLIQSRIDDNADFSNIRKSQKFIGWYASLNHNHP